MNPLFAFAFSSIAAPLKPRLRAILTALQRPCRVKMIQLARHRRFAGAFRAHRAGIARRHCELRPV